MLRAHQKVVTPHGEGEITSGTFSPDHAGIHRLRARAEGVKPGDIVHVQIRDKNVPASVVKLPFVRNGKVLAV